MSSIDVLHYSLKTVLKCSMFVVMYTLYYSGAWQRIPWNLPPFCQPSLHPLPHSTTLWHSNGWITESEELREGRQQGS
jgi:hypothetical protein